MTRDEAVRKAAALLRLAARGGTVAEAAVAAAKAQDIVDRFELTGGCVTEMSEEGRAVEADEAIESFFHKPGGELDGTMKWMEMWRPSLASGIARQYGCYIFRARRGQGASIEIVGRPSQVETVRYLYSWLSVELRQLAERHGRGMGSVWKREFLEGAAFEVGKVMREQRLKTVADVKAHNPHALVRIENALTRMDPKDAERHIKERMRLRAGGQRQVQRDYSARAQGAAAARSINMGAKVGIGAGARKQIGS